MRKLIIIGNGFDLIHQYKTTYKDFVDACTSPALETFKDMANKYYDTELSNVIHWYDFESMISAITSQWFQRYFANYSIGSEKEQILHEKEYLNDIAQINSAFAELGVLLCEYLKQATKDHQHVKLESISKEISNDAKVISFNYTDVSLRYTKNIYYIHGSIEENSIVLGYPLREDPCLMSTDGTMYEKEQLREHLDFKRFLISKEMSLLNSDVEILLIEMRKQISSLHSNRGEYDVRDDLDTTIKEYLRINNNKAPLIDLGIAFEDVEELVIMGHSLKADEDIIHDWLNEMKTLKTVRLFTFCGEKADELEAKKSFFYEYDCIVETVSY